jgi:hypothetical protein
MVQLLQQEVDEIRDVVEDIVSTMIRRKASKAAVQTFPTQQDSMAQLANDLAAMGIATAAKAAPAPVPPVQEYQLRTLLQPEPNRIQHVMVELQHGMMQLQHLIMQGRPKECCDVDKVRYNIGYSLGTLVRLFYGPTNLQNNPQALPDAFGLALQQTYVASESALQLLIAGLSGINVA